jgi:hypothetical protein
MFRERLHHSINYSQATDTDVMEDFNADAQRGDHIEQITRLRAGKPQRVKSVAEINESPD